MVPFLNCAGTPDSPKAAWLSMRSGRCFIWGDVRPLNALPGTGRQVAELLNASAGPFDRQTVGLIPPPRPERQSEFGLRQITRSRLHHARLSAVGSREPRDCADGVAVRLRALQP